jgi:hypothetical protein
MTWNESLSRFVVSVKARGGAREIIVSRNSYNKAGIAPKRHLPMSKESDVGFVTRPYSNLEVRVIAIVTKQL